MSDPAPSPSNGSTLSPPAPVEDPAPPTPPATPHSPPPESLPKSAPPVNSSPPPPTPVPSSRPPAPVSSSPPPSKPSNPTPTPVSPPSPPKPSYPPPPLSASLSQPPNQSPVQALPTPSPSPPLPKGSPPPNVPVPIPPVQQSPPSPPLPSQSSPLPPVPPQTPPLFAPPPLPAAPIAPSPPGNSKPSTILNSTSTASNGTSNSTISSKSPSISPGHKSSKNSSNSHQNSSNNGGIIGVAFAGVAFVFVVAFVFFYVRRKRKMKQGKNYGDTYKPSGPGLSVKSDGYYYKQAGLVDANQQDQYYASKPSPVGVPSPVGAPSPIGIPSPAGGYGYSPWLSDASPIVNPKLWFSYEELMEITNGFSQENVIGEGGFGCVYKGWLQDGREVAVKQLKAGSGQGEREFKAEVEIISRVHHRHLVSLVGYCIFENHRLLVYEFVPNSTLEHHLQGNGLRPLDWAKRVKIAIGSAKGLAYLHEDCHPRIIHRDIKSANILLDNSFEAKVADFGLAKLANDTNTHVSTRVMGTFGYLAPEYASSGKLTDRSDVFSFGVVLLELVTGRKSVDASKPPGEESLVEWARPLLVHALETGNITDLVDPGLGNNFAEGEMFRMIETAAACVRHSASKRPRMAQVVRALDSEGDITDLSNGVKYGQSTIFQGRNSSIQRFQRLAFGSGDTSSEHGPSGEFDQTSSEYMSSEHSHPRDGPHKPPSSLNSGEHP